MQKTNKNNILKILKTISLVSFLMVEFFGFGVTNNIAVAAGCSYSPTAFSTDKQTYSAADTVTFYAQVQWSGDASKCETQIRFEYYIKKNYLNTPDSSGATSYDSSRQVWSKIGYEDVSFQGNTATSPKSIKLNLSTLNWNDGSMPSSSSIQFSFDVVQSSVFGSSLLPIQGGITVPISGASQAGATGFALSVVPGPYHDSFTTSDPLKNLGISLSDSDLAKINYNVDVITQVNGKVIGTMKNRQAALLKDPYTVQTVNMTTDAGFVNGPNAVEVTVTVAGQPNAVVATGKVNINVSGLTGAGSNPGTPGTTNPGTPGAGSNPGTPGTTPAPTPATPIPTALYNPLPEDDLTHAFLVVVQGLLGIVGVWAVMFIIVGGFQMVVAAGNDEALTKAKKTITWAVLGLVVALLSFSIIAVVQSILQAKVKPVTFTNTRVTKI